MVGDGGTQFDDGQPLDETRVFAQAEFADGEILQSAHGLHAVQYVVRHLYATEQVAFGACFL